MAVASFFQQDNTDIVYEWSEVHNEEFKASKLLISQSDQTCVGHVGQTSPICGGFTYKCHIVIDTLESSEVFRNHAYTDQCHFASTQETNK